MTEGSHGLSQKGRQERVRMRSAGCWPLGGSLPTSLSIPLELSPYRDARYYLHTRRVEAFSGRSLAPGRNLDGPQEPGVLYDS